MPPRTKKVTLENSYQTCCSCTYCHEIPENKREVGCYASQPQFSHYEADLADFLDFKPVKLTRPICVDFKPKNGGN